MAVVTHPSPRTLAAFACGTLPSAELATVADHVARCDVCCSALSRMPDDTLAGLAKSAGKAPYPESPPAPRTASKDNASSLSIPAALANHPRYKVLGELGAGGMGVVYKAEHRIMGRTVALKVVAPELTAKTAAVERFYKEIHSAAQLNHPNVVTAHDADEAGGCYFLVMEFVDGISLDRLVAKKGPLPIPMAAQFARQAALGLQHASEKGMVHRDVKPQNLMVTKKAQVKILDFGLATFAHASEGSSPTSARTNPNLLMGTPDYLSPEQARNSHAVDSRSDVYSLGCTLFFLLTGKPPFAAAESLIDKLLAHTESPPPPIRELRPEVPEGLAAVLDKMMAKKPEDRYAHPAEVAAALLPFTRTAEASAENRIGSFEVIDAVIIPPALTPPSNSFAFETPGHPRAPTLVEPAKPRKSRTKRKNRWWQRKWPLVGAAALGAFVLTAAIAVALRKKSDPPPTDSPTAGIPITGLATTASPAPPKPNPNPWLNGGKTAKTLKVLFVLPSERLSLEDYLAVRERLEKAGVKVVTAGVKARAHPFNGGDGRSDPVKVDALFTPTLDVSEYSAVVFFGYQAEEFTGYHPGSHAAGEIISRMKRSGKVIAGISNGLMPLAGHGALKGKKAAFNHNVSPHVPNTPSINPIIWEHQCVVVDGKIVTAANPRDAREFTDALLKGMSE